MSTSWSENKQLLGDIINEIVVGDNETNKQEIFDYFGYLMEDLYSKQYSFKNFTQLNKHVLSQINDYIGTLQSRPSNVENVNRNNRHDKQPMFSNISEVNYGNNVTREEIHSNRDSIFKQRLQEKQNEMDMFNKKPAKDIDFSDKTDESNESIDKLLQRELASRNQDIVYDRNVQDKANDWIYNGGTSVNVNRESNDSGDVINNAPRLSIKNSTNINDEIRVIGEKDTLKEKKQVRFEGESSLNMSNGDLLTQHEKNAPDGQNTRFDSASIIDKLKRVRNMRSASIDNVNRVISNEQIPLNIMSSKPVNRGEDTVGYATIDIKDYIELKETINKLLSDVTFIKNEIIKITRSLSDKDENIVLKMDDDSNNSSDEVETNYMT